MNLSLTGLVVLLVNAGICGAIGRALGGGVRGGFIVSIAVGFIGAVLGSMFARAMHLRELWTVTVDGRLFPIFWSIVGAAVFVAIVHFFSRFPGRRSA